MVIERSPGQGVPAVPEDREGPAGGLSFFKLGGESGPWVETVDLAPRILEGRGPQYLQWLSDTGRLEECGKVPKTRGQIVDMIRRWDADWPGGYVVLQFEVPQ